MEILGKLGIDIKLFIAQIINFGLLLWFLKKFFYTPVVKRIEEDERELEKARKQKEILENEKVEFQKLKTQELAEARKKAEKIVAEAQRLAEKMKEHTQREIQEEKKKVLQQIRQRLKDLSHEEQDGEDNTTA